MKKEYLKSIAGLTLVEILIGIVVSSLMMAAMYSTYTIVNNSYNQVVDKAKISRSSRDLVELLIRDIRMSGFKYYLGTNELGYPEQSYLEFVGGKNVHCTSAQLPEPMSIACRLSAKGNRSIMK